MAFITILYKIMQNRFSYFCCRRFSKMLKLPEKKTAMREANTVFAFDNLGTTTYTKDTV